MKSTLFHRMALACLLPAASCMTHAAGGEPAATPPTSTTPITAAPASSPAAAAAVEPDPRLAGFKGKIAERFEDSVEDWPTRPEAPKGAPNVLIVLLDDVGFAQLEPYGGIVPTPSIEELAKNGLTYTSFHSPALCSPARAALLAGRNHHSIGFGSHAGSAMGFPGYNGVVPREAASGAKILQERGYTTYALGKWDHTPGKEITSAGPFVGWPSGDGFDHFYGFMAADTNNFLPVMYDDHRPFNAALGKPDYHVSTDMADRAIEWIRAQRSVAPGRPFFMLWAPGAAHSPHHAPKAFLEKFRGKFDMGWDAAREQILTNQIARGIFPQGTQLSPRPESLPAWDSLSAEQKKMYARQMEAFAAQVNHVDQEIGRMVEALERTGQLDDTLIMITSDNGASAEGGLEGSHNEARVLNGLTVTPMAENLKHFAAWGTTETHNHYHAAWAMAGNTPFKYFKQSNHAGGTAVPLVVHWPRGFAARGELRRQNHHIIDIVPTALDVASVAAPSLVDGVKQMPLDGTSMRYSFDAAQAPTTHPVQYYEMFGNRALYADGWKAVVLHGGRMPWVLGGTFDFDKDVWELYDLKADPAEAHDVAATHPEKLTELKQRWHAEALKYNVFPLYDDVAKRAAAVFSRSAATKSFTYYPGSEFIYESASPGVKNHPHTITAKVVSDGKTDGVIVASGGHFAGYTLYVKKNVVTYTYNYFDEEYTSIRASRPLKAGAHEIRFDYEVLPGETPRTPKGRGTLFLDGEQVGQAVIEHTVPGLYSVSDPFDVGADNGSPVERKSYDSPNRFSDQLESVHFELK